MSALTPALIGFGLAAAVLATSLAVDISNQPGTSPAPEPAVTETYNSKARQPDPPELDVPGKPSGSGTFCAAMCTGPHLNLSNGKFSVGPSFGPGIQF